MSLNSPSTALLIFEMGMITPYLKDKWCELSDVHIGKFLTSVFVFHIHNQAFLKNKHRLLEV